jgi:hypothetical protein
MELLESQDPEKRKLIEKSERHKRELEKEVTAISNQTEKMLTNALIIGGALAFSYFIVTQMTGKSKKKKKHKSKKKHKVAIISNGHAAAASEDDDDDDDEVIVATPNLITEIGARVVNQATAVLIDLARQKLMEYLESRKKDENP